MPGLSKRFIVLSRLENCAHIQILRANNADRNNEQTENTESPTNRILDSEIRLS